eukprot:Selendium_serpulae@DN5515_c0_g1_i1.p1
MFGEPCPLGYQQTSEGCVGDVALPPEVSCPDTFTAAGVPVNDYAWRGKQYVTCGRAERYKGKLWCPSGYYLLHEPFPNHAFGQKIVATDKAYPDLQDVVFRAAATPGFDTLRQAVETICIQALAVFHHNCDKFKCKTPVLDALDKTVRNWAFYKWEAYPDTASVRAIPRG